MQFYAFMVVAVAFWMQTSLRVLLRPGGPGPAPHTEPFLLLELSAWDMELATEMAMGAVGFLGQQLLCRESGMLLGRTLSADSLISSHKLTVQDESSGGQITGQGAMPCSVFTRTSQHDTCPLSNQRSASPDSWPYADNSSSSCLGKSAGIMAWVGVQGQARSRAALSHCPARDCTCSSF